MNEAATDIMLMSVSTGNVKRASLLVCVAAVCLFVNACREQPHLRADAKASARGSKGGPRIMFNNDSHDFGHVVAGQTVLHLFTFKNTGDKTLVIENVSSSCGCTAAVLKNSQTIPGATGQIEVRFSADAPGPFLKHIAVSSNDPRRPGVTLTVRAVVDLDIDYEPHYIKLITDDPKYRATRVWLIGKRAKSAQPRVTEIRGDPALVRHVVADRIQEQRNGERRVGFELKLKGTPTDAGNAVVIVATGLDKPTELAVPFSWGKSVKLRGK